MSQDETLCPKIRQSVLSGILSTLVNRQKVQRMIKVIYGPVRALPVSHRSFWCFGDPFAPWIRLPADSQQSCHGATEQTFAVGHVKQHVDSSLASFHAPGTLADAPVLDVIVQRQI